MKLANHRQDLENVLELVKKLLFQNASNYEPLALTTPLMQLKNGNLKQSLMINVYGL